MKTVFIVVSHLERNSHYIWYATANFSSDYQPSDIKHTIHDKNTDKVLFTPNSIFRHTS